MQYKTPTAKPTRKVIAAGVSGAISVLVLYLVNTYVTPSAPLPAEVGSAISALIAFAVSYFVPPAGEDTPVPVDPPDPPAGRAPTHRSL